MFKSQIYSFYAIEKTNRDRISNGALKMVVPVVPENDLPNKPVLVFVLYLCPALSEGGITKT